jgi:hypothetical protein
MCAWAMNMSHAGRLSRDSLRLYCVSGTGMCAWTWPLCWLCLSCVMTGRVGDLPDRRSHGIPALIRQSGTVWVWVPQEGRITNLYITKLS